MTERPPWRTRAREQGIAIAAVGVATLVRLGLGMMAAGVAPFASYFPAVFVAALYGGGWAAATAVVVSSALGWALFMGASASVTTLVNVALFVAASAALGAAGAHVRGLMDRLRTSESRCRTLFDAMSEGFALAEVVRDEAGKVVDWRILEINPALQAMFGVGPDAIGRRLGEIHEPPRPEWCELVRDVLETGRPRRMTLAYEQDQLWRETLIDRVDSDRFCQFVSDITERKRAEGYQAQLFQELNHRVKNNLQMVASLLRLQAGALEEGPARTHLTKAVHRVHAIGDVHESLYRQSGVREVDFAHYLETLCERLSRSILEDGRVRLELAAEPVRLPVETAVPLGMVINELVTNAAKHAYPAPQKGVITVTLAREADRLRLDVVDGGVGFDADARVDEGLGLRLLPALVQQAGGTIESLEGPGAGFRILLPSPIPPERVRLEEADLSRSP